MWQDILNIVISNGIFATLFVCLLAYLLKDSAKREDKYTQTINSLNKSVNEIRQANEKVDEIKEDVGEIKDSSKESKKNISLVANATKEIQGKLEQTSSSISSINENLKTHSKLIKKVSRDVKGVKNDVKEIKKVVFPKEELWKINLKAMAFGLVYQAQLLFWWMQLEEPVGSFQTANWSII